MAQRGFDMDDVINCFDVGKINCSPQFDRDRARWKYVVDGRDLEGGNLSIVFTFEGDDSLVLITGTK
jgi:hypothetical protein